jgi:hypothetical protein
MELEHYPPASAHDPISQLLPNIYWVHGSVKIGPGMQMNRNMLIIKQGPDLTLINPVRLHDQHLHKLDALGQVQHLIRLGDFHGLDDAFYLARYPAAAFYCQTGQSSYPAPAQAITIDPLSKPPIDDAEYFIFASAKYPEAALLLKQQRLLITTDSVQYLADWSYTSPLTRVVLWFMGFKLGLQIGRPWLKRVSPNTEAMRADFARLLNLDFDCLIAAHGSLLQKNAKALLADEVAKTFRASQ